MRLSAQTEGIDMEEKELTNDVDVSTTNQTVESDVQEVPKAESTKDQNIKALREEKERAEQQARQYQIELMRYQQQQANQQAPKKRELKPDDVAEGQDIHELRRELEQERIYRQRPDMDTLVNGKMGALIDEKYPRMAQLLASIEDPLHKKAAVYDFIKEMKLDNQQEQSDKVEKVIKESENKTKTLGSAREVSQNPLDNAYKYSDKGISLTEKQRLRAETDKYKKY